MRKRILTLVLVPMLAAAVWAETGWTHTAARWTHGDCKISLNVPAGMTPVPELDKDGYLTITSDQAQVMLLPTNDGAVASKALEAFITDLSKGTPAERNLKMGELQKTELPNGHVEAYVTQGVNEGGHIDVSLGILSQKGHYVVFTYVVAHQDAPKAQVNSLMSSITFAD